MGKWTDEMPTNVMESLSVGKVEASDVEVSGKFIGKNACTAYVNFDGTTTPPTIRDSFNVSDVVKKATGQYEVYFEEGMVNTNYIMLDNASSGAPTTTTISIGLAQEYLNKATIDTKYITPSEYGYVNLARVQLSFYGGKD